MFGIININDLHTAGDQRVVGQYLKINFVFLGTTHSLASPCRTA